MVVDEFVRLVKQMRRAQKGLSDSAAGTLSRQNYFNEARMLERKVDKLLDKLENGQKEIF